MLKTSITMTNETFPIIEHIQQLQDEIKKLEADLKQHKDLLLKEYMQEADMIVSQEGLTLAQIVRQEREYFQAAEFKKQDLETYNLYVKTTEISYLKVS